MMTQNDGKTEGCVVPVSVIFNAINVVSMAATSLIASGQNSQPDWNSQGKINSGNGISVNTIVVACVNTVIDQDLIDTPITQPENINPQPTTQI